MTPGVDPEDAHFSYDELVAGVSEARRFHRRCACHAHGSEGILNATRAGAASIEHGIFMTPDCVEEMCRRGTYLVPTLSALKNILLNADQGVPAYAVEKAARVAERHLESVRMFYKAGGLIAMGTDAGTPFNRHGVNATELSYMVDIGMSPRDTIIAATRHGSDLLDLPDSGVLGEGRIADMVLVDGNPLENIAMIADRANHRSVVRNGVAVHERPGAKVAVAAE
jgi:imidazolonepropionase-like amidohydrolase